MNGKGLSVRSREASSEDGVPGQVETILDGPTPADQGRDVGRTGLMGVKVVTAYTVVPDCLRPGRTAYAGAIV
jgi:hypothetical protein